MQGSWLCLGAGIVPRNLVQIVHGNFPQGGFHAQVEIQRVTDRGGVEGREGGVTVADVCRQHGIGPATFYQWRSTYGEMSVSDMQRLRELEAENSRVLCRPESVVLQSDGAWAGALYLGYSGPIQDRRLQMAAFGCWNSWCE